MSVPMVPHRFVDLSNLDMEKVNDNLEAIAADVNGNLAKRYTYSQCFFDLTGLVTASAQVLREFAIRRFEDVRAVEVVGVEIVLFGNVAGTATVTCSNSAWPVLSVTTSSTTTEECRASQFIPVSVPSEASDVTFTVAFPAAYTVTAGYLVIHTRCDRGNQGDTYTPYAPTLIDSSSSTTGSLLDTQLQAAQTSVVCDTTADRDMRVECYVARSLAAGSSLVFRAPSGARRIAGAVAYLVAANTEQLNVTIDGGISTVSIILGGDGVAARAVQTAGLGVDVTQADDPTDATDDLTVTLEADASGAATLLLAYVLIFWD